MEESTVPFSGRVDATKSTVAIDFARVEGMCSELQESVSERCRLGGR